MTEILGNNDDGVPVVAVGASAGGLAPLEDFFGAAQDRNGWCYVVLQHLSADYRSVMDQLLERKTGLDIAHIEDGAKLKPDTIYLNLPNTLLELEGDTFRTRTFSQTDALPHLPIDGFFLSLAKQAQQRRCVAVVLSGSGADGARGVVKMQEKGGSVLVQAPKSAKFSSMPRAALATGAVDRVAEAADLPGLIEHLIDGNASSDLRHKVTPKDPTQAILRLLEDAHQIDFSQYKSPTVIRRIERRLALRGVPDITAYRDLLERDSAAVEELYQDMLIGVTEFFRDPGAMAALSKQALRRIVETHDGNDDIRIWVCACASGQEAYSIAIALSELLLEMGRSDSFRIIATDVHRPSIAKAAAGVYPLSAVKDIPDHLRQKYFADHRDGVVVDAALRKQIIFSVHNALADPPFMKLDLVSCRNLLIYLDNEAQSRLIALFQFALKKHGFMFLGGSEALGQIENDFETIDQKSRLYQKTSDRRLLDASLLATPGGQLHRRSDDAAGLVEQRQPRPPLSIIDQSDRPQQDRASLLRGYDALLKRYAPSSILMTDRGEVLTWFGAASAYIDTLSDLADRTLNEIVHPSLHYPISVGIEKTRKLDADPFERIVTIEDEDGNHTLTVTVEPLSGSPERGKFLLVRLRRTVEEDTADSPEPDVPAEDRDFLMRRIKELERDLRLTDESLQYVTERLEASGEELQASNEELQASNEELQASNEELEASNEELHAVNEELVTVSEEHEGKIALLNNLSGDIDAVFGALGIGVIIVDEKLSLRRFTRLCGDAFGLMPRDLGRALTSVGARPDFLNIANLSRKAIETDTSVSVSGDWNGRPLKVSALPIRRDDAASVSIVLLYYGLDDDGGPR